MHEEFLIFFFGLLAFFLFLGFPIWALILLYSIRNRQDESDPTRPTPLPPAGDFEKSMRAFQGNVLTELRDMRREINALRGQPVLPPPVIAAPPPPPIPASPRPPIPASPRPPIRPPIPVSPPVESAAIQLLRKAWNWLIVGEEFRRKDVSIEFAIATNWLMRIGVLILVVGVGFFIKYSIDHGYLGPQGRVAMSVIAGAAMVAGGLHLFGKRYHLLGQGLAGGGIAVLYFSMFAAGSLFKMIPLPAAFGGMLLVTFTSGVLAVRFKSLLIALLGMLGGYLTPVLLSTGVKNFPVLYGYLLLLGLGMLGVSWKRQWPVLVWLAFLCHSVLVGVSLGRDFVPDDFSLVMPFLAAFFLLFSTAVFIYNVATRTRSSLLELIGLLLAATVFFAFGYWTILTTWPGLHENAAWLALGLCVYYIVHVYALQFTRSTDKPLETVFLGLGAIFLSITLPLLLSKGWLTVTWAMEALVLLWMGLKLQSPILRLLSSLLYMVVIGRVCFYDMVVRFHNIPPPENFRAYLAILGPRLLQFGMPVLSLAGAWRLLKNETAAPAQARPEPARSASSWLSATALVFMYGMLFLYLNLEMHKCFSCLYEPLVRPGLTLVWAGLGFVLLAYRRALGAVILGALWGLLTVAILVKLLSYDFPAWQPDLDPFRYGVPYRPGYVLVRLLDFGLIIGFALTTFRLLRPAEDTRPIGLSAGWLTLAVLLVYLTLELGAALHAFLPKFHGGGISLLWAAYAFAVLLGGMRNKVLSLRLVGLALFAVVVWKIFLVDLSRLEAIYRVIAFMALGVVLLLASFLYLKNKDRFSSEI